MLHNNIPKSKLSKRNKPTNKELPYKQLTQDKPLPRRKPSGASILQTFTNAVPDDYRHRLQYANPSASKPQSNPKHLDTATTQCWGPKNKDKSSLAPSDRQRRPTITACQPWHVDRGNAYHNTSQAGAKYRQKTSAPVIPQTCQNSLVHLMPLVPPPN